MSPSWQDVTARAVQRLAFGDLSRFGYPRPAVGPFTRQRADGVTIAVDDGFARALRTGRVVMKPGIGNMHVRRRQARQLARAITG